MNREKEEQYRIRPKDCGCSAGQAEEYLKVAQDGRTDEQILFLKRHRKGILEQLHLVNRQIDCIDFCIYELEGKANERY